MTGPKVLPGDKEGCIVGGEAPIVGGETVGPSVRQTLDRTRFLRRIAKGAAFAATTPFIVSAAARPAYADDQIICGFYDGDNCIPVNTVVCGPGKTCTGRLSVPGVGPLTGRECVCE